MDVQRTGIAIAILAALLLFAAPAGSSPTAQATAQFIQALAFDPHDTNRIWAAVEGDASVSLYRSDDGAGMWHRISGLPRREVINALALDQSGQNLYVAARYHPLMWQSSDGGATWRRVSGWPRRVVPIGARRSVPALVQSIVVHRSRPETVYAVTANVVFRSSNAGRTWRRASRGLPKGQPYYPWIGGDLVADGIDLNVLYLVTHSRGVYRTADGGRRWVRASRRCSRDCLTMAHVAPTNGDYVRLAADPSHRNRLYAGAPSGIYRSGDGGDRWPRVLRIDRNWAAEGVAVASDGTVYANGTFWGGGRSIPTVARSDDAGRTWTRTLQFRSSPPGTAYLAAGPLAVDPTNPAVMLAVVAAGDSGGSPLCVRLLKTTNRGGRWTPADGGLVPAGKACRPG
jgi:photosystem II stability/assembly factor-like uncharacterized protein